MTKADQTYLETLLRYYEEEIEGEAYFAAIAERLDNPEQKRKMQMLADVETYAAAAVQPLLDKYALTPMSQEALHRTGRQQAADSPGDFAHFMAQWRESFPGYIDDFARLEAMAPPEDLPPLKVLTNHEVAAIDFLEREAKGAPDSTQPMEHYLATGTA